MVIKVLVSGISASKEVKKRQQRAMLILDSAQVDYFSIDITEPGRDEEKAKLLEAWKERKGEGTPLPPQFFNDEAYLGDFEDFNSAVDVNEILQFLKLGKPDEATGSLYASADQDNREVSRVSESTKETEDSLAAEAIEEEDVTETTEKEDADLLADDENERGEAESGEIAGDSEEKDGGDTHDATKRKEVTEEDEGEGDGEREADSSDANKKFKSVASDEEVVPSPPADEKAAESEEEEEESEEEEDE